MLLSLKSLFLCTFSELLITSLSSDLRQASEGLAEGPNQNVQTLKNIEGLVKTKSTDSTWPIINNNSRNSNDQNNRRPLKLTNGNLEYPETSKYISIVPLEAGHLSQFSPTSPIDETKLKAEEDERHSKGSKGRKGVQFPSSSIVARKGVDALDNKTLGMSNISLSNAIINQSDDTGFPNNSAALINKNKTIVLNKTSETTPLQKLGHLKKPEVVSDEGDADDFAEYSIIKTSTTGEDYVIIGIVIVIGIWCSVFGALIFYRRAEEYWDRRHYRRMDFLVEGMYND